MKKNRKIVIPAVVLSIILGAGVWGVNNIYASDDDSDPKNSLIEKIAEKFNLNKDDLQKVFDEEREERIKEMEEKFETSLNEAISRGELTEAQKNLILEKRAEIKSNFEANKDAIKDLSREEMSEKMKTERDELKKWAQDNGIDEKYLMGLNGHSREHGGPGSKAPNKDNKEDLK